MAAPIGGGQTPAAPPDDDTEAGGDALTLEQATDIAITILGPPILSLVMNEAQNVAKNA